MENFKKLSRAEMRSVLGGDSSNCCCTHSGNSNWNCGLSQGAAQKQAFSSADSSVKWCCASCSALGAPAPCEA